MHQEITEQDWDNWQYIERGNIRRDDRACRRSLRTLQKVLRRRRHATPSRNNGGGEDGEEEDLTESEYQRRMDSSNPDDWPAEPREQRRQRYLQSTMSECSDPGSETGR